MIICLVLVLFMFFCFVGMVINNYYGYSVAGMIFGIVLMISIGITSTNREEIGKEKALKQAGYTTYTQDEIYNMSQKEIDSVLKTYKNFKTTYWKEPIETK